MIPQDVEDALEAVITDSLEPEWTPRSAARHIMLQLSDIGLEIALNGSISAPNEPGAFNGDLWFGDPTNRTLPTHEWDGECWRELPELLRKKGA